jgi:hypothetical protein
MKLWVVTGTSWGTDHVLVIRAESQQQAWDLAGQIITQRDETEEIPIDGPSEIVFHADIRDRSVED